MAWSPILSWGIVARLLIFLQLSFYSFIVGLPDLFNVDVDDVVEPFSEFSPEFNVPIDILFEEVLLLTLGQFGEDDTRTLIHELLLLHILFDEFLLEFHQVVDLHELPHFPLHFAVISVLDGMGFVGKVEACFRWIRLEVVAPRPFGLASEVKSSSLRVSRHPEV